MEAFYVLIVLSALIIGISCSIMGGLMVLQKKTLLGDVVSHAILPGVLLGFLISENRSQLNIFTGALITGWLAIAYLDWILKRTKLKSDAALAIVLSSYFSLGLVIYSWMQNHSSFNTSGLSNFIYGQLLGVSTTDVIYFSTLLILCLLYVIIRFKFIIAQAFQEQFLLLKGFKVKTNQMIFNSLLVLIIAMGVQAVGVILMSALLIMPYLTSAQFKFSIRKSLVLAVIISVLATVLGCVVSFNMDQMPTGPWIILFLSVFFFISLSLNYFSKK